MIENLAMVFSWQKCRRRPKAALRLDSELTRGVTINIYYFWPKCKSLLMDGMLMNDMNTMDIPPHFDETFLAWFRERTEAAWVTWRETTLEQYRARNGSGLDWQRGTRWLGGLSDDEIARVEQRWHVRFPPDYRLFLQRLYAVDKPMRGARFEGYAALPPHENSPLLPVESPAFPCWLLDDPLDIAYIKGRLDWLYQGFEFDLEHNALWPASWRTKPPTLTARKARMGKLLAAAPAMIPVHAHRYLLGDPCQAGNPVLSIYQSDIIVYGADLRSYLLKEFADLLGIDQSAAHALAEPDAEAYARVCAIPFWGEIIEEG